MGKVIKGIVITVGALGLLGLGFNSGLRSVWETEYKDMMSFEEFKRTHRARRTNKLDSEDESTEEESTKDTVDETGNDDDKSTEE